MMPKRTPQRPHDVALARTRTPHHKGIPTCPLCAGLLSESPFYTVGAQMYYKARPLSWGALRFRFFFTLLAANGAAVSIKEIEMALWGRTGVGANLLKANATHLRNSMRDLKMPYALEATPGRGRPRQESTREPPGYRLVALPRRAGGL